MGLFLREVSLLTPVFEERRSLRVWNLVVRNLLVGYGPCIAVCPSFVLEFYLGGGLQ